MNKLTLFEEATGEVTMYLVNGVRLNGEITGLDTDGSYLLTSKNGVGVQKVMRHAIASIMPASAEGLYERRSNERGGL